MCDLYTLRLKVNIYFSRSLFALFTSIVILKYVDMLSLRALDMFLKTMCTFLSENSNIYINIYTYVFGAIEWEWKCRLYRVRQTK